jgi:hypothetical protein
MTARRERCSSAGLRRWGRRRRGPGLHSGGGRSSGCSLPRLAGPVSSVPRRLLEC